MSTSINDDRQVLTYFYVWCCRDVVALIPRNLYKTPPPDLLGNAIVVDDEDEEGSGIQIQLKLLSEDPQNYKDAPSEAIRRILQIVEGREIGKGEKLDTGLIGEYLEYSSHSVLKQAGWFKIQSEWEQQWLQMRYWNVKARNLDWS